MRPPAAQRWALLVLAVCAGCQAAATANETATVSFAAPEAPPVAEATAAVMVDAATARVVPAGPVAHAVAEPQVATSTKPLPTATPMPLDAATAERLAAWLEIDRQVQRVHLANLANVVTPGYQRRVPVQAGTRAVFAKAGRVVTDRSLDVAIDGDGLFAVRQPDGSIGYTRNGAFRIDAQGCLVTADDLPLLTEQQPQPRLPADTTDVFIDHSGRITAMTAGSPESCVALGRLLLVRFPSPADLRDASGYWQETAASGASQQGLPGEDGFGTLWQGCLERSNVNPTRELILLQVAERRRQELLELVRLLGFAVP